MKIIIIITILLAVNFCSFSQGSVDSVLAGVERNNTTLSAYRKSVDADKIGNKTGIMPQNPEAEFNYLWGHPSAIGNRTDFSIRQSFDFPMAYAYRSQISNLKNEHAELEFQKQRREIRMQTRLLLVELTYQNALKAEYSKRLYNAQQIAVACKSKYDIGEAGILEHNKAQVNLLNVSKDLENIEIERTVLLSELIRLNGGIAISFSDSVFIQQTLPPDFEQWYTQAEQNNPVLQWLKQEIAIAQKQEQLNVAQSLPKFHTGYMSEKVTGQQYQGITVGITIPLWENRNTVKYAKAKTIAVQGIEADTKLRFYNEMKTLHAKAIALQNSTDTYRNDLKQYSNTDLLKKALDKGEISLAEYFFELSLYYESTDKLLEMERGRYKAYVELIKYDSTPKSP